MKPVLMTSNTYQKWLNERPNREQVLKRHQGLEEVLNWPETTLVISKDSARKKLQVSKDVFEEDLLLYSLISEHLEYGKSKRPGFLRETSKKYQDKVPSLGCSFDILLKIINEIEEATKKSSIHPLPSESTVAPSKPREDLTQQIQKLEEKIAKLKASNSQQALKSLQFTREIASLTRDLDVAEKEKAGLEQKCDQLSKEKAGLSQRNTELSQQVAELESRLATQQKIISTAEKIITHYKDLVFFSNELGNPLEDTIAPTPTDQSAPSEKDIDVLKEMPTTMETNGQKIKQGPGLKDSLESLNAAEKAALLEALKLFARHGSKHRELSTEKFLDQTIASPRYANITFSKKGIGFTWKGGDTKSKQPTIIFEARRNQS